MINSSFVQDDLCIEVFLFSSDVTRLHQLAGYLNLLQLPAFQVPGADCRLYEIRYFLLVKISIDPDGFQTFLSPAFASKNYSHKKTATADCAVLDMLILDKDTATDNHCLIVPCVFHTLKTFL
ncbi:MAG: hypothetical protein L3J24_07775 [Xanthomonadales bacterium]|nr:hypothetical protein [Xanthomonadales bacterium]